MPKVYLAGYDGSADSKAAVDLAVRLAQPIGARVITVTGYETAFPSLGRGAAAGADAMLSEEARHEASAILTDIHIPGVERVTQPGTPARALCAVAESEGADLIVVGTTHRGQLGRIVPGSTAEQLLHGAPCAIAVAPVEHTEEPIRTVAVAYDGETESVEALAKGEALARDHGARLRLLAVHEPPGTAVDEAVLEAHDNAKEQLEKDIARIVKDLPAELQASAELLIGRAGKTLVAACGDGVDLLVAGSRCYGPLHGALVGSVSRYLVDHAPCSVLIVPRGSSAPADRPTASVAVGASG
jgi:nucleotide-binding universal stress UspA family protein